MLTPTSTHPYYECTFERKFQAKIYITNKNFGQSEEYLIELTEKQQMEPKKFSSEHI